MNHDLPTVAGSEALLDEAARLNPGPWVAHSRFVADAARRIAEHHPQIDPTRAQVLGLLHDIGRRAGIHHLRHLTDGYRYLNDLGYSAAARICLSHSFPVADLAACGKSHV